MRRLLFLAGVLSLLSSCGKEPEEGPRQAATKALEVSLNSFTYESLMSDLSDRTSLDEVVLRDGARTRRVSLRASDNLDPDQAGVLVFHSNEADSVDLTVSPNYVAIRMTDSGRQKAWIAYGDPSVQEAVEERYALLGGTSESGAMTRSAVSGGALSLDLTAIAESMAGNYELPEVPDMPSSAASKGFFSSLWNKVVQVFKPTPAPAPKAPTIDIYLCKERGANPLEHEMNWQVDDAIVSLRDVQSNVKFNVHIVSCDFQGSNDSSDDLWGFWQWVRTGKYRNTNGVFMLCRWGGWGSNILGRAYVGDYDVNTDLQAYGVTCTNAWYSFTMAHEIGHIFGAEHVEMNWYDYLYNSDLMCPLSAGPFKTNKHKNANNREEIKRRLTFR